MRVTTSLYVRNLLSKLHPPLPTTPRQSKQLLNILETSFRKHLDDVHPAPQASIRAGDQSNGGPLDPAQGPVNATNLCLESVLRHPLLAEQHVDGEPKRKLTAGAVWKFDQSLLRGGVPVDVVRDCARQYHRGTRQGEKILTEGRLGPRIAAWFSGESGALKKALLTDHGTISDVLLVMYIDGLEDVVWNWLRLLYERSWDSALVGDQALQTPYLLRAEDDFVSTMMRASIQRGVLNDAAQHFVQACEYRVASGRAAVDFNGASDMLQFQPLLNSWKRLSASVLYRRNKHGISAPLFDQMVKYHVPFSFHPVVSRAFLFSYHPSEPSAQTLYQELQSPTFVEGFLAWQKNLGIAYHKSFLLAILDAAQLSMSQGGHIQARFLLEFAEKHYPKFISTGTETNTADRLQQARQEVEPNLALNFSFAPP